jgi:hypothetical protein
MYLIAFESITGQRRAPAWKTGGPFASKLWSLLSTNRSRSAGVGRGAVAVQMPGRLSTKISRRATGYGRISSGERGRACRYCILIARRVVAVQMPGRLSTKISRRATGDGRISSGERGRACRYCILIARRVVAVQMPGRLSTKFSRRVRKTL